MKWIWIFCLSSFLASYSFAEIRKRPSLKEKHRFITLSSLLTAGDVSQQHYPNQKGADNSVSNDSQPVRKFQRFDDVKSEIEDSDTIEEALNAGEEIPAIQRSADRAMKIMSADLEDAILSLRVLFKISNIVATNSLQKGKVNEESPFTDLSVVHRIEHVADCVTLNLRQLSSEDLIVAAWSLNTIKLRNQEYIEAVMNEYGNRMAEFWVEKESGISPRLSIDDIAAMIWTVGSHRDQYGWSNITLINELVRAFSHYHGTSSQAFAQLDPRMNIRILWAMSLFNILRHHQDFATQGVSNILPFLSELTPANKVSTLWCVARARLSNASIVVPVIDTVNQLLSTQPESLREHEVNYILQSAKIINERMRRLLMDHKSNLSGAGFTDNSYHLALDEAIILKATEKMLRTLVVHALPTMDHQTFQSNLNILRVLGRMELLDEDKAAFKAFYDRFREKVEAALSMSLCVNSTLINDNNGNIPLISPTDAADVLELIATTVEYPGLLQGELANVHLRNHTNDASGEEAGQVVAVEEKTRLPKAISSSVGVSNMIQLSSVSSHHWHELMGKLGVYISCYRKEISDQATFVHAAWALARMGHALKPLCRKARTYAEHQQLSELPIQVLSRLVVGLATEQASLINNAASVNSPVSYDFIGKVSAVVLARLSEVTLLSDLSQIVFSVAFLGRVPHYNKAVAAEALAQFQQQQQHQQKAAEQSSNEQATASSKPSIGSSSTSAQDISLPSPLLKSISLRPLQLMFLSTEEIIGLYWSTRQLATDNNLHIFDSDTMQRLIQEVQRRLPVYLVSQQTPSTAQASANNAADLLASQQQPSVINFKDSFLLVKSLSNSAEVQDRSLDPLKDQACALLMQQCGQLFQPTPAEINSDERNSSSSDNHPSPQTAMLSAKDVQLIGGVMRDDLANYHPLDQALEMHVSVLIDTLQAFIDLRWFKEDMITTCEIALSRLQVVLHEHFHHPSRQQTAPSSPPGSAIPHGDFNAPRMLRLSDSHVLHFQFGVLSQLLSIYRELPLLLAANEIVPVGKLPAKKKPSTILMNHFPRLHGLFSRFLGNVPASVASDEPAPAVLAPMKPSSLRSATTAAAAGAFPSGSGSGSGSGGAAGGGGGGISTTNAQQNAAATPTTPSSTSAGGSGSSAIGGSSSGAGVTAAAAAAAAAGASVDDDDVLTENSDL